MSKFKNLIESEMERYNEDVTEIIKFSDTVDEAIDEVYNNLRHPMDMDFEDIEEEIREYYFEIHNGDE
mgnify:FL=1|jgi:hypothetical protein